MEAIMARAQASKASSSVCAGFHLSTVFSITYQYVIASGKMAL